MSVITKHKRGLEPKIVVVTELYYFLTYCHLQAAPTSPLPTKEYA